MAEALSTALGSIQSAPASADNQTVILWVVGVLMGALGIALVLLKRKMDENELNCQKANAAARSEAEAARAQSMKLYEEAVRSATSRETKLVEVVERNTSAWDALREDIGSGGFRALREAGRRADRDQSTPH